MIDNRLSIGNTHATHSHGKRMKSNHLASGRDASHVVTNSGINIRSSDTRKSLS